MEFCAGYVFDRVTLPPISMKHLLLLLAVVFGVASLPTTVFAKDKKKDYDDDSRRGDKEVRNNLNALQNHYDQVKDRVKNMGGDRRQWEPLRQIRADIDRLNAQVDSGNFDSRDIRGRIQRANDDLRRVQDDLEGNASRHGGRYRPY